MNDPLQCALHQGLAQLTVRAWRLHLETPGVQATVPLLRGVWGAALHDLAPDLYRSLFEGAPSGTPGYLVRPAPAESLPAPALEFLLFGPSSPEQEAPVWAAWELALERGLGPERRRARLLDVRPLAWDRTVLGAARRQPGFALAPLPWPTAEGQPWRLEFPAPLRLLRNGRLITAPTLADIVMASLRRVRAFATQAAEAVWERRHDWLNLARGVSVTPFQGQPFDLVRYSGRQRGEIDLHGVAGEMTLPAGPGPLADLLLAAGWLHIGKSTVMGLGQLLPVAATGSARP